MVAGLQSPRCCRWRGLQLHHRRRRQCIAGECHSRWLHPCDLWLQQRVVDPVGKIATEAVVKTRAGNAAIDATLLLKPSKAEWNKGNTRSWQAPKGYKRVTAARLVDMIKNFSF